jgi:hypothetical protein
MPESYEPFDWSPTTPIDEATLDNREAEIEQIDDRVAVLEAASKSVVNIKDYGAVGNGTTNDTTAIQTAIDYAEDNGGIVYIPRSASPYRADGLILRTGVTICGDGQEISVIQAVTGSSNAAVFNIAEGITQYVKIENLGIIAAGNAGQHGIYIWARRGTSGASASGLWHFNFKNVRVYNFAGAQIWFRGGGTDALDPIQFGELFGMVIERRNDSALSVGTLMSGQVNQTTWVGGRMDAFGASSSQAAGVDLKICRQLSAYDSTIDLSTTYASTKSGHTHSFHGLSFQQAVLGAYLDRAESITFDTCHFEGLSFGARAVEASLGVRFNNCHFANAALGSGGYCIRASEGSLVTCDKSWFGGTVGLMATTDGGSSHVDLINQMTVTTVSTSNITRQLTPAATLDIKKAKTVLLNSSATPITTLTSFLFPGERVAFRGPSSGSAFIGSGGNISLAGLISPLEILPDGLVTLVRFDKGPTNWIVESVRTEATGVSQNTVTTSYILVLVDAGGVVEVNSTSNLTVTVPPNSDAAFPIGTLIEVLRYGTGTVTLIAGTGVTLLPPAGAPLTARVRYSPIALRKRATDEWVVSGDLG